MDATPSVIDDFSLEISQIAIRLVVPKWSGTDFRRIPALFTMINTTIQCIRAVAF